MKTKFSFGMAVCGLVAATALVTGCGNDDSGSGTAGTGGAGGTGGTGGTGGGTGGTSGGNTCTSGFPIIFSPVYSAYDGTNTYQVPLIAYGITGDVKWTASDPEAVDFDPGKVEFGDAGAPGKAVMITTRKAGKFTITGSSGSACGSAELTVTQATAAERETGSNRYNNGVPISFDGGRTPACNNCHGSTNPAQMVVDVQHTPQQTGGYSDEELTNIFLKGEKPANGGCRIVTPCGTWSSFHKWDVSDQEAKGIIFYLRSLQPAPQGGITIRPPGGTGRDGG